MALPLSLFLLVLGCGVAHVELDLSPPAAAGEVRGTLAESATWEGIVEIADDLLIPRGVTLTIRPGTVVRVRRADTSRTEPEFLDNSTEILVRGRLVADGSGASPIIFEPLERDAEEEESRWGGIYFDGGGGSLRHCRIAGAEQGLVLISASPLLEDVRIEKVKHGIVLSGPSRPRIVGGTVEAEEGGIYCWEGSEPLLEGVTAIGGEREGLLVAPGAFPTIRGSRFEGPLGGVLWGDRRPPPAGAAEGSTVVFGSAPPPPATGGGEEFPFPPPEIGKGAGKVYRGENYIPLEETWEGEVLIDGTVMVAPGALLKIRPGTVVRFAFRDSNGDGIGESEIFVQGRIEARGEKGRPIVFSAAEGEGPGLWGAVNIMGSDEEENVLSWCLLESSYRGLHSHFSSFRVEHSLFRNNLRALQFQESRAVVTGSAVTGNSSGLRFRDSTAVIEDSRIERNTWGLQALRSQVSLTGSNVAGNVLAGVHLRESEGVIAGNRIVGNTPGLRASGGRFRLEGNLFAANGYGGLQVRESEAEIEGNSLTGNFGNGAFTDSPALVFRRNSFEGNLRFALENNSPSPVDAALNYWGVEEARVEEVIFDGTDDPAVGDVVTLPVLEAAPGAP